MNVWPHSVADFTETVGCDNSWPDLSLCLHLEDEYYTCPFKLSKMFLISFISGPGI
jgi:hypothetical protein